MKAHQNQFMKYDDMYDHGMFNEAAHPARGNLLTIYGIINNITVQMLNERKISVRVLQFILIIHSLLPLLEGRHLAY